MRLRLLLIAVLIAVLAADDVLAGGRRDPFWASSDGKGTVSLFWLPGAGLWPQGGYRLERIHRGKTAVLASNLGPGRDPEAMTALDPGDADEIRRLAGKIAADNLTDTERNHSISAMGRTAATNPVYGRALGVRFTDRAGKGGKRRYRLTALDRDGQAAIAMESDEVSPAKRTPPPAPPTGLTAGVQAGGVALFWIDPPATAIPPVIAYHIERVGRNGKARALTVAPHALNRHLTRGRPDFLDTAPSPEDLVYRVSSLDIFGRRSAAVKTRISAREFQAATAPAAPASQAAGPRTATPQTAALQPPAPPRKPAREEAARKDAVPPPPVPDPPASDPAPSGTATRIDAAAPADGHPPAPILLGIQGFDGKVTITLKPAPPEDRTDAFLVLRSSSPTGPGVVVGRPLPASTRKWEDDGVEPGQHFWYRLIAVDRSGRRSEPTRPWWVRVGNP
jgi:hypothetical protein